MRQVEFPPSVLWNLRNSSITYFLLRYCVPSTSNFRKVRREFSFAKKIFFPSAKKDVKKRFFGVPMDMVFLYMPWYLFQQETTGTNALL